MEFSFDANPEDISAIGAELTLDELVNPGFDHVEFSYANCDPLAPTEAKPGSQDKVKTLAARYAAGIPLWHDSDCYDHGPQDAASQGLGFGDDGFDLADDED